MLLTIRHAVVAQMIQKLALGAQLIPGSKFPCHLSFVILLSFPSEIRKDDSRWSYALPLVLCARHTRSLLPEYLHKCLLLHRRESCITAIGVFYCTKMHQNLNYINTDAISWAKERNTTTLCACTYDHTFRSSNSNPWAYSTIVCH